MTAISPDSPQPRPRPAPHHDAGRPAPPLQHSPGGKADAVQPASFAALLCNLVNLRAAPGQPEAFEAASMLIGADKFAGDAVRASSTIEAQQDDNQAALKVPPNGRAPDAPGAFFSNGSVIRPLDTPPSDIAPARALSAFRSAIPQGPPSASPSGVQRARPANGRPEIVAERAETTATKRAESTGQLSRFAILLVAGEEGPLLVLRLPRMTGKERQELEIRAAEMIARRGQPRVRIAIQEVGGDQENG